MNLGSIAGSYPYPGGHVHGGTKAFVKQFSLNLKADLVGTFVRVTDVEPGLCGGTEFSAARFGGDEAKAAVYKGTEPLTADDIADTVAWVISLPRHVNINRVDMMPTCQAPFAAHDQARRVRGGPRRGGGMARGPEMKKVIALAGVLALAPLLGGCLSSGSGSDPTLSGGKYGSYEERSKCQDTSEGGQGKQVCY